MNKGKIGVTHDLTLESFIHMDSVTARKTWDQTILGYQSYYSKIKETQPSG